MVQCGDDVLLSQSVYERCHSTPLHGLVSILFRTATLHLSHFVFNICEITRDVSLDVGYLFVGIVAKQRRRVAAKSDGADSLLRLRLGL